MSIATLASPSTMALVALFTPPYQRLSYVFPSYLADTTWHIGQRVAVPLGSGMRAGIITNIIPLPETTKYKLKHIIWPLENRPLLPPWYLAFAQELALRQTLELGQILATILPNGIRTATLSLRVWHDGKKPYEVPLRSLKNKTNTELALLGQGWEQNQVKISDKDIRKNELCLLEKDPPWAVLPSAKVQSALLEKLYNEGTMSRQKLLTGLGTSASSALITLIKKELISICPEVGFDIEESHVPIAPPVAKDFQLTPMQSKVFSTLEDSLTITISTGKATSHLLFGVTGSGKTAIYLELAAKTIAQNRSVLLLAPEIALAHKLYNDVKNALPQVSHHLYHGSLTPTIKAQMFSFFANDATPHIIVGTRSALFLPNNTIGLIILDEEHDGSFKQDEGLPYQAKEIAWFRAGMHGALLLLGSATPDIKTFYAAEQGHLPVHELSERVGGSELPDVSIIRLGYEAAKTPGGLMPQSISALQETVAAGEQAVVLLNRRGYSPLMYCLGCGTVMKCPSCDIALAYHKGRERLTCHYCGYTAPFPSPCPQCKNIKYLPMGDGTEKLEESLSTLLPPGTGILRLDRDTTRRQGSIESILAAFARKEASVLVGTQMLSKGHHFPDVTLAIIADADLGLNLPDYRAAERIFQLIVQSSGRSGRGEKEGKVIIQTRNPDHYCWKYVHTADYRGFYSNELALRKKYTYPPFTHIALIRMSFDRQDKDAEKILHILTKELPAKGAELGLAIMGPIPAPIPFLKNRMRFQCLIKSQNWQDVRSLFIWARQRYSSKKIRFFLDLDPINML